MQKLSLNQSLQQKLSPQQIQFIKLLQVPTAELENRIEEELELNPVLEEGEEEEGETQEEEARRKNRGGRGRRGRRSARIYRGYRHQGLPAG